jgi:cell division protein YceG involved in septum cleavage
MSESCYVPYGISPIPPPYVSVFDLYGNEVKMEADLDDFKTDFDESEESYNYRVDRLVMSEVDYVKLSDDEKLEAAIRISNSFSKIVDNETLAIIESLKEVENKKKLDAEDEAKADDFKEYTNFVIAQSIVEAEAKKKSDAEAEERSKFELAVAIRLSNFEM